jgi:hypothetical protein
MYHVFECPANIRKEMYTGHIIIIYPDNGMTAEDFILKITKIANEAIKN